MTKAEALYFFTLAHQSIGCNADAPALQAACRRSLTAQLHSYIGLGESAITVVLAQLRIMHFNYGA